uniref:Dopey_N domain-containing protein n=1 Tax=Meloidogyne hapla TaxID=6305 RepID=A0A1I8BMX9_MELHA
MTTSSAHNIEATTSAFLLGHTPAQQNNKYKAYASAVDKALKSFESTTEWADLIAALGKLGKVFSSNAKSFNDIPNALTVSKRLSQCLHPALPSGVHLKALDTYRQVFLMLSRTQNLAKYLFLYSAGLFPLMDHCQIKVKSELLSIFEQFILPLGPNLRPALSGFITALLLALEEGTEFYGRAFDLLDQLLEKVGTDAFYLCFWQSVSGNPSARLPALIFVNTKIEKHRKGKNDINNEDNLLSSFCGGHSNNNLILQALCCVAEDSSSSPLVQRHLLDFLCMALPLNSKWTTKQQLVDLVGRTLFLVLRRDMSLNRRLYQWLLNRSNDMAFVSLPVNGVEDSTDLAFFKQYTLPVIKCAIRDYLRADAVVEIAPPSMGTLRREPFLKKTQIQFPEVRVCRLLHYMLDRPELGQLVLEEILPNLLETFCLRDPNLLKEFGGECEAVDPSFENFAESFILRGNESINTNIDVDVDHQTRRTEEILKNFNSLLKALEPNFLWNFFEKLFSMIKSQNDATEENESDNKYLPSFSLDSDCQSQKSQLCALFPVMILYSLKNVQLDVNEDIRSNYLPKLLKHILYGIDLNSSLDNNYVAIIIVCRHLLAEINQSSVSNVFESLQNTKEEGRDSAVSSPNRTEKREKELAGEQQCVESSLEACLQTFTSICNWYIKSRERDRCGVLLAICLLVRDFADFPFYSLQPLASCSSLTDSIYSSQQKFELLHSLIAAIDPVSWKNELIDRTDFEIRAKLLDLILYLSVRSLSMIEQHSAVAGRVLNRKSGYEKDKKTTTTVLLRPFLSIGDLQEIDKNELFMKSALALWKLFSENTDLERVQTVALLLLQLHSRKVNDSSSEVEEIIVSELTCNNKNISGEAARKFRDLWAFCRSAQIDEVYTGIALKPMNRVVMVMLGFIADDSIGFDQVELRAIAFSWFQDCARNNDLHKILQMLALMLLNPTTARVSIQFVEMSQRITQEQIPILPPEVNCVSLTTISGRHVFHHVCKDVDKQNVLKNTYINCDPKKPWVSELNQLLLLPSDTILTPTTIKTTPNTTIKQNSKQQDFKFNIETNVGGRDVVSGNITNHPPNSARKSHNRTLSDIPQFDNDAESVDDSISLDCTFDHEIIDTVQFLVDSVCLNYEEEKDGEDELNEAILLNTTFNNSINDDSTITKDDSDIQKNFSKEPDEISLVGSLKTSAATAAALPRISGFNNGNTSGVGESIKRIRTGHRRQDSLQESIFSTGTHELRLFDPTELPNSTCPGDYKQPLLDETYSHMLFYAETPSMVDLGRAERLFHTIGTLLKSGGGIGREIVTCMLFTNISNFTSLNVEKQGKSNLTNISQQLMEMMSSHYRHIQGEGFWEGINEKENNSDNKEQQHENKTQQKNPTLLETFSTILLYYFRSYYLNSPTNHVSEDDLVASWKCKISALDCFSELLRILEGIVRDAGSKEFTTFVQHAYRQTKTQKVVLTLMLAAVPTPPNQKKWRMPLTMDIAEFNNGPRESSHFRDLIYAYHRSLLNLTSSIVILEHSLLSGMRYFNSNNTYKIPVNFSTPHITENQINYNSSQNRSTIRESRYSVVELRLFLGVILNALKRCPERHELWLQFLIGILPYLDRALATHVVHVTEQICRNLCEYFFLNNPSGECWKQSINLSTPTSPHLASFLDNSKNGINFVDYRYIPTAMEVDENNQQWMIGGGGIEVAQVKYPANYIIILMESLMSILHFSMVDSSTSTLFWPPQRLFGNSFIPTSNFPSSQQSINNLKALALSTQKSNNSNSSSIQTTQNIGGGTTTTTTTFSSSNMTSMVGSAISVIPGTGLINNLFGRSSSNGNRNDNIGKTPEWLEAQKEMIRRLPGVLAILSDIWTFVASTNENNKQQQKSETKQSHQASFDTFKALIPLLLEILNPIAKKHKNVLINSFGIMWIFRPKHDHHHSIKNIDQCQCTFLYSSQQLYAAKLLLKLKTLTFNSIICSISETLKDCAIKGSGKTTSFYSLEVSLLELLHECVRQVSTTELRESWISLQTLFNESTLSIMPARASFLQFMILVEFVRRVGCQTIFEDRLISKTILDVCQRLTEAVNSIVGWQLESTTWLKRTLVVRQDAASQKSIPDLSPVLDQKALSSVSTTLALSASTLPSEASSMRGSTISLSGGIPSSRIPSALDIQSTFSGTTEGGKKQTSILRSSIKDHSGANKKDPTDSTQAIFLLAENLTELIDSITRNEDKDKLLPTLQAVWNNTLPYLKSKSAKNVRSFLASSQLLASMSSFNYMRPIWKKNAMELLWDNSFFKMDIHALKSWLIVIDNLMTNDKTSFKELLARITTSTSTTFSTLITSKEQEYEMRAQYLKRLAFVILSSARDQYSGQLNEIHERLTENLRLCQAPVIHSQVFTCYRVLLVRMSPHSFVSVWPSMITEMVQILAQIEQHLLTSPSNLAAFDEQRSARDDQLLQLFLAGCKLLETLCILPSGYVPQFQMCKWTFVSPISSNKRISPPSSSNSGDLFLPYSVRLNRLLNAKYGELSQEDLEIRSISLFNVKTLTSLHELRPFFHALAQNIDYRHGGDDDNILQNGGQQQLSSFDNSLSSQIGEDLTGSLPLRVAIARIEQSLCVDFAEHWQL